MADSRIPAALREHVTHRAKNCCEYCYSQSRFAVQPFSIEHINPTSKGGLSTEDNLALSCQGCNNHKYNKTQGSDPISGQKTPLYHPRIHAWTDHFVWNEDYEPVWHK
ncbi:MAG: HNH endonuclease [Chloroflexi bacterium]|nr:HNH endonuclease [Chloroflexota bacterium]MCC6895428.1 HNH endonuclease [Anaerolineae bacterium]